MECSPRTTNVFQWAKSSPITQWYKLGLHTKTVLLGTQLPERHSEWEGCLGGNIWVCRSRLKPWVQPELPVTTNSLPVATNFRCVVYKERSFRDRWLLRRKLAQHVYVRVCQAYPVVQCPTLCTWLLWMLWWPPRNNKLETCPVDWWETDQPWLSIMVRSCQQWLKPL